MEGTQQSSQMASRCHFVEQLVRTVEQKITDAGTVPNNIGLPSSSSQPRHRSEKSNPRDKKPPKVAGDYSGTTILSARRLNQQQIRELETALQAAKTKEAQLKQALRTVKQEKTDISQSLVSARKQEINYKRQEKKCDVNDIKVKYRKRTSHP